MSTYLELLVLMKAIATKYKLDIFMNGFQPVHINALMVKHIEAVKSCDTYDKCMLMLTASMMKMGIQKKIEQFITDEKDLMEVYRLYNCWRSKHLNDAL